MHAQRLKSVCAAGWFEPAPLPEHRADQAPIPDDRNHQQPRRPCWRIARTRITPGMLRAHGRRHALTCRRINLPSTRSSSAARSRWHAPAARGLARMTSRLPAGRLLARARATSRSRRRTRLRTTAPPTARLTTNPTRAGTEPPRPAAHSDAPCASECLPGRTSRRPPRPAGGSSAFPIKRCTVSSVPTPRRPRRTARSKSVRRRILAAAGNTTSLPIEVHESGRPSPPQALVRR